jgi:xylose isomerase
MRKLNQGMGHSFTYSTRLNSFKARPDLYHWRSGPHSTLDLIERAARVAPLDSVELNYPEHFVKHSPTDVGACLSNTHLTLSGINLRYDTPRFLDGGFTNPQHEQRAEAIQVTLEAMDVCRQLGGTHVVVWPAYDGFDYAFEADYAQIWDWEVAALRTIGAAAGDLRVSIEYKPCDPRKFSLLGNIGATLLALEESGTQLGVTLDFSHMLMASEQPALSAALCIRKQKLFGIHLNDGYGQLDDGLMVGSVHLMQTVELLYYLVQARYDGVIYFDTFPMREDPVLECTANVARVEKLAGLVKQFDPTMLRHGLDAQDGFQNNLLAWEALFAR